MSSNRKAHTKSRTGCATCKVRRVKCDETKPACGNCLRGGRSCHYIDLVPINRGRKAVMVSMDADTSSARSSASPWSHAPPNQSTGVTLSTSRPSISRSEELYLMHHFSTISWVTLANLDSPGEVHLWRDIIPREGMKHEFLMDGLLAFSAFHLAYLEPSSSSTYLTLGTEYQGRSLLGFKAALDYVDDDNAAALFASSIFICILTFSAISLSLEGAYSSPAQSLQSICELLRGTAAINGDSDRIVRSGMFDSVLEPGSGGPKSSHNIVHEDGIEEALAKVGERIDHMAKYVSPAQRRTYISGLESLRDAFQDVLTHRNVSTVIAWPVCVDSKLMELFQQNDPMAQLLWTHYGVLLLYIDNQWWGKGFGVRIIRSLSNALGALDDEWSVYTTWALACAQAAEEKR